MTPAELETTIARLRMEQPDNDLAMQLCAAAEDLMLSSDQLHRDAEKRQFDDVFGSATEWNRISRDFHDAETENFMWERDIGSSA